MKDWRLILSWGFGPLRWMRSLTLECFLVLRICSLFSSLRPFRASTRSSSAPGAFSTLLFSIWWVRPCLLGSYLSVEKSTWTLVAPLMTFQETMRMIFPFTWLPIPSRRLKPEIGTIKRTQRTIWTTLGISRSQYLPRLVLKSCEGPRKVKPKSSWSSQRTKGDQAHFLCS